MKQPLRLNNHVVAASLVACALACATQPLAAQTPGMQTPGIQAPGSLTRVADGGVDIDRLLADLARPDQERWQRIERQIIREWSRSGSPTVDFLFQRGQVALRAGQPRAAIAHFSAALDHAPDFAEGYNARATAYFMDDRLGQSMADIEQVLALNPQHFGALSGLGMILEQVDRLEEARAAYQAAHALNPHRPSLREALDRLELALGGRAL